MKRASRRKRTSRRNPTARLRSIQSMGLKLGNAMHKIRQRGGAALTIEEERRLDGMIEDIAMTLQQLSGESRKNLVSKIRKALGYTYP